MVDKSNKSLDDPDYADMAQRMLGYAVGGPLPVLNTIARYLGGNRAFPLERYLASKNAQPGASRDPGQPPYIGVEHRTNRLYFDPRLVDRISGGFPTERQWFAPPDVQPSVR